MLDGFLVGPKPDIDAVVSAARSILTKKPCRPRTQRRAFELRVDDRPQFFSRSTQPPANRALSRFCGMKRTIVRSTTSDFVSVYW
jgi:hypothetical protein